MEDALVWFKVIYYCLNYLSTILKTSCLDTVKKKQVKNWDQGGSISLDFIVC